MTDREIMQQALDMIDKLTWALETHLYIKAPSDAKPLMDALRTALAQGEQDISYTDIQMAELIMSDCGHSSDYTPLLNRIAGRLATYCQALAQPEQTPVAWMYEDGTVTLNSDRVDSLWIPLYTSPPRKPWVGLTLNDITGCMCDCADDDGTYKTSCFIDYAKAIEQKLKDLNI